MDLLKDSPVGITERAIAIIIDYLLILGAAFLLGMFIDYHMLIRVLIISHLYEVFLPLFWNGYTIGKRIIGIRIAHVTGKKLNFGTMILRVIVAQILYRITAGILTFVSIYFVASRKDHRAIHDLLALTYVTENLPDHKS